VTGTVLLNPSGLGEPGHGEDGLIMGCSGA
jgi:hypothetical protein